jgi:hypothetical protein
VQKTPPKRIIISTTIALTLFLGGILLLLAHVPFWSYIVGLPSAQIGTILLILTYEKLSKHSLDQKIEQEMRQKEQE